MWRYDMYMHISNDRISIHVHIVFWDYRRWKITMVRFTCTLRYVSVLLMTVVTLGNDLRLVTELLVIRRDDDNTPLLAVSSSPWKNHSSGAAHFRAFSANPNGTAHFRDFSANPKHHNTSVTGQALPGPFYYNKLFLLGARLTTSYEEQNPNVHVDVFGFPGDWFIWISWGLVYFIIADGSRHSNLSIQRNCCLFWGVWEVCEGANGRKLISSTQTCDSTVSLYWCCHRYNFHVLHAHLEHWRSWWVSR